ncbi:MAG: M48 family metallopeptidase, partial [Zoogloea sp.]|nr:M48 family metallopeptidase [Zoogloea sp.]
FLRMIVVHELAHIKEREHDKAFYQLCRHMEPDYHQLEFDLRADLSYLEATGLPLWTPPSTAGEPAGV